MATLFAKMIAVVFTFATLSGVVHAQSEVSEDCHDLYNDFTHALSLQSAGTIAIAMMEENCCPSL